MERFPFHSTMRTYLRSVDPDSNRYRWYSMHIQLCIGGGVDLIRQWGRIGKRRPGGEKIDHFETEQEAIEFSQQIIRRREHHNYGMVYDSEEESEKTSKPTKQISIDNYIIHPQDNK